MRTWLLLIATILVLGGLPAGADEPALANETEAIYLPVPDQPIESYQWYVDRLTPRFITTAQRIRLVNSSAMRRAVDRRIDAAMVANGPAEYQQAVAGIRRMATRVVTAKTYAKRYRPKIDGLPGDKSWRFNQEPMMTDFSIRGSVEPSQYRTQVRMIYDPTDLYLMIESYQAHTTLVKNVSADERDGTLSTDDNVEVFIRSNEHPERWAQFAISASGALFDQWDDGTGKGRDECVAYDFDCEWAVYVHRDHWAVEMRVPWEELQISPKSGQVLRVNVVRNVVGGEQETSSWYPEVTGGGHAALAHQGWVILKARARPR